MAQSRDDPTLRQQHGILYLRLISRFPRPGWHDGNAVVRGHLVIGAVQVRLVATRPVHARSWIVGNDQLGRALIILKGSDVASYPVAQILAQRGPSEGVGAGAQGRDEQ